MHSNSRSGRDQQDDPPVLDERHDMTLFEGSAIAREVTAERGTRTVRSGREVPKQFSWRQKRRAPGILFPSHFPGREPSWILRPDRPDPKRPGYKYCQPPKHYGGAGNTLDAHPSVHHRLDDPDVAYVITEGIKKGDAITSKARKEGHDVVAVAISGVWNWLGGDGPIPDLRGLLLEGRKVYVCFDSDMLRNPNVMEAAMRLAAYLQSQGAEVWIVYLKDAPDGSKVGADDFFVGGGTLGELLALARPFDPDDLLRERLSRDEVLARMLDDLARIEEELPTKTRRDCSKKATWRTCREAFAERYGEPVEDGVMALMPSMPGAEDAGMSQNTFSTCVSEFIAEGRMRRIKAERPDHADSYVMITPRRAELYNNENSRTRAANRSSEGGDNERTPHEDHHGYRVPRAPLPELRWPYVAVVREKDERGRLQEVYEYVARLGKKRGEVVRCLLENGGSSTVAELMERFAGEKTRPRDFKRRLLADLLGQRRQHQGSPLSVGPAIVELDGDVVRLVEGWLEALEVHRTLGREQDAAIKQKTDHLRWRAAYRAHLAGKHPTDPAPSEEEMAQGREARQKRRRIEELVREGMRRDFAAREVIGADGYVEDLSPVEAPDPPPEDWKSHPLDCNCLGCASTVPSYASARME